VNGMTAAVWVGAAVVAVAAVAATLIPSRKALVLRRGSLETEMELEAERVS